MKVQSSNTFRSPAYRVFAHLTEEERIDQACELLAKGVLRLAEKRGLLAGPKKGPSESVKEEGKTA